MYISQVADSLGLSVHTLRYYEKEGLLRDITRDEGGRRVYSPLDIEWLTWIQRLKSTGMSLDDIKRFAELRTLGDDSLGARKNMLIEHSVTLKANISRMQDELSIVEYKIKAYEEKEKQRLT